MKPRYHNKKILFIAGTVLVFSLLWVSSGISLAAPAKSLKDIGTSLLGIGGTIVTFIAIGQIALALAGVLLTIASNILDFAFQWNMENIFTNIVSAGPITVFWGYARDLTNGVLILILLWIAFGIIFSLERFNARRLLVRVILVGLLINFSLTLTSSVFYFANALAKPFAEQLKKAGGPDQDPKTGAIKTDSAGKTVYRGISTKIVEITNVHTVMNAAAKNAERIKALTEQQQAAVPAAFQKEQEERSEFQTPEGPPTQIFAYNTITQQTSQVKSLPGINEAEAVPVVLAPLVWGAIKLVGGTIALSGITTFLTQFTLGGTDSGPIGTVSAQAFVLFLNPFVGALFLLVATFVIGSLAILFMARGIVIILLAILSPLAFASLIIPGQDKYWKMWLGKLINWSFFAPISFFLLLFAMHVGDKIQGLTAADARGVELQASLPAAFQFALILGLLISALAIAKYMGIQLAATLMSAGERYAKAGLGAARGFAMRGLRKATLPAVGQVSGYLEEKLGKQNIYLQRFLGLPAAGLRKVTAVGRKEIGEARKQFSQMKPEELQRAIAQGTFLTQADRTAAVLELAARKKLALLPGIEGYAEEGPKAMRDAIDRLLRMGGDYMDILKANPTIAKLEDLKLAPNSTDETRLFDNLKALPGFAGFTNEQIRTNEQLGNIAAQFKVWEKIDPGDLSKIDTGIYKDSRVITLPNGVRREQGDISKELFIRAKTPEFYRRIMGDDPDTGKLINDYLRTSRGKELVEDMDANTFYFFSTPQARSQGWSLPPDAVSGKALQQDLDNIGEQIRRLGVQAAILASRPPTDAAARRRHNKILERIAEMEAKQDDTNRRLRTLRPGGTPTPPPPAGAPTP